MWTFENIPQFINLIFAHLRFFRENLHPFDVTKLFKIHTTFFEYDETWTGQDISVHVDNWVPTIVTLIEAQALISAQGIT